MRLDREIVCRVKRRIIAEGIRIGFYQGKIWIRSKLPWSEDEDERPWSEQDSAQLLTWARTATYPIGPRIPTYALTVLALERRFWPSCVPIPTVAAQLIPNNDGTWRWMVLHCPYCGAKHYHGVGLKVNPRNLLNAHHSERCEKPIDGLADISLSKRSRHQPISSAAYGKMPYGANPERVRGVKEKTGVRKLAGHPAA